MNIALQTAHGDYSQLSSINGIRLQPLINLKNGKNIAWEVLSWLKGSDAERWFSTLSAESHLAIFCWQVDEVIKYNKNFWLNLPVKVLSNPGFISHILSICHQNRLTIEVQDPENIVFLDQVEVLQFKNGIQLLRRAGWPVWLDDVTSEIVNKLPSIIMEVDGIKINRNELKNERKFRAFVQNATVYSSNLLAEGIEDEKTLEKIIKHGIVHGQGFLWPETKIELKVPSSYFNMAKFWSEIKPHDKARQEK
jgi:EAL domain-containing protein (putative c-di-GMP-specific phosphodiesterase class I)